MKQVFNVYDTAKNAMDKRIEYYKAYTEDKIKTAAEDGRFKVVIHIGDVDNVIIYKALKKYFRKQGFKAKIKCEFISGYHTLLISWKGCKK